MIARFQLYQSVIQFTMVLRDAGHYFRVNEIIDPKDASVIKGWEVRHTNVHFIAPQPTLCFPFDDADRRFFVHEEIANVFGVPINLQSNRSGYMYTRRVPILWNHDPRAALTEEQAAALREKWYASMRKPHADH